jgi:release factor glutamine methyltransferase
MASRVARAAATLEAAGVPADEARQDAALLARHVLNWDLGTWLTRLRDDAPEDFSEPFARVIARRARREPVAYITGEREFFGRSFRVSPAVLIPRQETELIVEEALAAGGATVVDIGTGSGALAISLALELPDARVVATDISPAALIVARDNADRLGATGRVEFRAGAFFAGADDPVDLIVSNPPYVAERDRLTLMPEVADFEPDTALFSGPDGLDTIRELFRLAPRRLTSGGTFIVEFGLGQAGAMRALVDEQPGLRLIRIREDLQRIPRVLVARKD